jgi:AraC-like DNA-binding protein
MVNLLLTNRGLRDLNPIDGGYERCKPGKSFGPHVRTYTLIHYVLSGKGTFYARGESYPVEAGQAFLILPDEVTTYTADVNDPWHYCWIGFDGMLSAAFSRLDPVLTLPSKLFAPLLEEVPGEGIPEYRLAAMLFSLYDHLLGGVGAENQHVSRVENYIRSNYMLPLRVEDIAGKLNLNRRYLGRLFKEHTGHTIQEFLIEVRLEAASMHLRRGCSVAEAARLCGYEDVSNFSKMFKRRYGIPPAAMRR